MRGRSNPSLSIEYCIREDEGTLSTRMQDERNRGDGHNLLQEKIHMDIMKKILIVTTTNIAMNCTEK